MASDRNRDVTQPFPPVGVVTQRLGRYELLRRLGSDNLFERHLARVSGAEGFQKDVVLKRLLPSHAKDREFVQAFLAQAKAAATLQHPSIVQILDLGREGDDYFYTTEFVHGEPLGKILALLFDGKAPRDAFSLEHAVAVGIAVASALAYAHERKDLDGAPLGLMHGDLSPQSVVVTYEGGIKVTDFGMSKVTTRGGGTKAGPNREKAPYLSPEQCQDEQLDHRTDIFSLGTVLYEACTHQRLFEGANEFIVMNRILIGDVPPPSTISPDFPRDLERILMRTLQPDRGARYQDAAQLQRELESFAVEHRVAATPSHVVEAMKALFPQTASGSLP